MRILARDQGGPGSWGEVKVLLPDSPSFAFGDRVALSGDLLAVTATFEGPTGAVYLFERDAGGVGAWGKVGKITLAGTGCWSFASIMRRLLTTLVFCRFRCWGWCNRPAFGSR